MNYRNTIHCLCVLLCLAGPALAGVQPVRYNLTEKQWLDQHPVLQVGVVEQTAPLMFFAGGSNPQGLVADYLRALAMHLGLQLDITRYPDQTQLLQALRDGEVDALGAWPVDLSKAAPVLPSRPYLKLPVTLYATSEIDAAGLPGLRGKSVAVLQGSVWEQLPRITPGLNVVPYPSLEQALQAAAQGRVFAYLGDAASADYLLKRQSFDELEPQLQLDLTYDLALATRFGQPELLSLLQKGLDRIGADELYEIWHRWPGVQRPQHYSAEFPSWVFWVPLLLVWSLLLVWGVHRYVGYNEQQHHSKLKRAIRRLQRREKSLKEKLLALKRKCLTYRGEARQHRQRQRLLDQVMPSGTWVWEPDAAECQWDTQMYALFRQDPDGFQPTPEAILGLIHEEDRAQVSALFQRTGEASESRISYRVVLPDGELRRLIDFSDYSIDQAGSGEQRIGLCWDVTEYESLAQERTQPQPVES